MPTVTISTASPYEVIIEKGLIDRAGEHLKKLRPTAAVAIITDSNVAPLYFERLKTSLLKAGYPAQRIAHFVFPAGESAKSMTTLGSVYAFLAENRITRSDLIVALGGGVTGDLAGYAAATWLRGVDFIQIPTTLLAQIDSSVGGKTGIDIAQGKNLVGAFHQPLLVLADPDSLSTLPAEVFADGMAEAVKYTAVFDLALFERLEKEPVSGFLETLITRCVELKRQVVEADEFDRGDRMLLNFGHTLGHAIERLSSYQTSHGQAVAMGSVLMTRAAEKNKLCQPGTADRISKLLAKFGLPTESIYAPWQLATAAAGDKKTSGATLTVVLLHETGKGFLHKIEADKLESFIR